MDRVTITDIKFSTIIGVHPFEQTEPQSLHLDVSYATDAEAIAKTDALENAIDYDRVLQSILALVKDHQFKLIETLAQRLADQLLTEFQLRWLQLTLHKPRALLNAKDVAITLERSRP